MGGSVQWIADFTESYRKVRVQETTFDALLEGDIKPKGLLIARIIGFLLVPNYYVAAFILRTSDRLLTANKLRELIETARAYMKQKELKWSWLIVVVDEPSGQVKNSVRELRLDDMGIALLGESSGECFSSGGLLGDHLRKCAVKALREAKTYNPSYPRPGRVSSINLSRVIFVSSSIFLLIFLGIAFLTGYLPMILTPIIVIISASIGLFLYYSRMRLTFSYDPRSFMLKHGRNLVLRGEWSSVEDVSVIRRGFNSFYLELKPKSESPPGRIPVSSLRIDPFPFRIALLDFLQK